VTDSNLSTKQLQIADFRLLLTIRVRSLKILNGQLLDLFHSKKTPLLSKNQSKIPNPKSKIGTIKT
jgi:hypothetical protein